MNIYTVWEFVLKIPNNSLQLILLELTTKLRIAKLQLYFLLSQIRKMTHFTFNEKRLKSHFDGTSWLSQVLIFVILQYWKIIYVTMVLYANVDEMQALFAQTSVWFFFFFFFITVLDACSMIVNLPLFSDRKG